MAGRIILPPTNPSLDGNGVPVANSTYDFYLNNTTTPQAIYADAGLATPLANPLTCDAAGRFPQIWTPAGAIYSVKWTVPGESPITYNDIVGVETNTGTATFDTINAKTAGHGVAIQGVTNVSDATSGYVGEYGEENVLGGAASPLVADTVANVTAKTLPAGDYDVWGVVSYQGQPAVTLTKVISGLSVTSLTLPTSGITARQELSLGTGLTSFAAGNVDQIIGPRRVSSSGSTTVYLVARASFSGGSASAYGQIRWRRVR